jgi:plastocyanin domain-containing protein
MSKQIAQVTLDIAEEAVKQGLYGAEESQTADGGFGNWLSNILRVAMVLGVVACLGLIIWGAIEWITSSGDKSKIEFARNKITTAIIGLIVLAATMAIFSLVASFLGITVIKFV